MIRAGSSSHNVYCRNVTFYIAKINSSITCSNAILSIIPEMCTARGTNRIIFDVTSNCTGICSLKAQI